MVHSEPDMDEMDHQHQNTVSDLNKTDTITIQNVQDRQIEPIRPDDPSELTRLASRLTPRSSSYLFSRDQPSSKQHKVDELQDDGGVLDPTYSQFDVYEWAKKMIQTGYEKSIKQRKAGVLFQNLNVYGSGPALSLQKTVGSLIMAPINFSMSSIFGKKSKRTILRQFDGVLRSGEMLIALGRPGSGCSTLLKTISGDLHGLDMDKHSVIQYSGITPDVGLNMTPPDWALQVYLGKRWSRNSRESLCIIKKSINTFRILLSVKLWNSPPMCEHLEIE